jgi:hypothetical protein
MTDPDFIDPSQLRLGPIRHRSLSSHLLDQIRAVYELIGHVLDTTLEQFEIGFMRDSTPEQEVAIWCSIAAAWLAYHEQYLADDIQPKADEKKLIAALGGSREKCRTGTQGSDRTHLAQRSGWPTCFEHRTSGLLMITVLGWSAGRTEGFLKEDHSEVAADSKPNLANSSPDAVPAKPCGRRTLTRNIGTDVFGFASSSHTQALGTQ